MNVEKDLKNKYPLTAVLLDPSNIPMNVANSQFLKMLPNVDFYIYSTQCIKNFLDDWYYKD